MSGNLAGRQIAILVADGVYLDQLTVARRKLEQAGSSVHVISPTTGSQGRVSATGPSGVEGVPVDVPMESAAGGDYDGLLILEGGSSAATFLDSTPTQQFIAGFSSAGKPIGAWERAVIAILAAHISGGRRVTCIQEYQSEFTSRGYECVDEDIVVDSRMVTGRGTESFARFCDAFIEEVASETHARNPVPPALGHTLSV